MAEENKQSDGQWHKIIPNTHFAGVSTERLKLYQEGYYYACIGLSQSVAEALARFLCERSGWRPKKGFEINIANLKTRGKDIQPEVAKLLEEVWGKDRDDFHHLNSTVPRDLAKLKAIASEKTEALNKAEKLVFDYGVAEGKLILKYPKYWDFNNGMVNGFLRFEL